LTYPTINDSDKTVAIHSFK